MHWLRRLVRVLIDFALPPRCPGCGAVTPDDHQFCATCWQSIQFLGPPGCVRCGAPVDMAGLICAPCLVQPPRHDGVRAVMAYGPVARRVALRLKYNRRIGHARLMARFMVRLVPPGDDIWLMPVPLHRLRLWRRGYNQSALVAQALARHTGRPLLVDGLRRVRRTRSLAGLGRTARAKELRAAFRVAPKDRDRLRRAHVVLIDDVYTSGATANACARALKAAGVARVDVLVWARVVDDHD